MFHSIGAIDAGIKPRADPAGVAQVVAAEILLAERTEALVDVGALVPTLLVQRMPHEAASESLLCFWDDTAARVFRRHHMLGIRRFAGQAAQAIELEACLPEPAGISQGLILLQRPQDQGSHLPMAA